MFASLSYNGEQTFKTTAISDDVQGGYRTPRSAPNAI